jgi:molybdopterin-guanine dinucleotide biosynthesis protein A
MDPPQEITGVILAGGQSSRFGSNKALALWRGKLLIQHVRDSLSSVFDDILLSTNSPDQYMFLKMPTVIDRYPNMGPLAGIHAALHHSSKPWIFVVGCDMPAITPDLISFLSSYAQDEFEAVLPWLKAGPEPLCGLYHKTALAKIEMQLANRKPQLKELIEKLSVRKVAEEELRTVSDGLGVFININSTKDLENL